MLRLLLKIIFVLKFTNKTESKEKNYGKQYDGSYYSEGIGKKINVFWLENLTFANVG